MYVCNVCYVMHAYSLPIFNRPIIPWLLLASSSAPSANTNLTIVL